MALHLPSQPGGSDGVVNDFDSAISGRRGVGDRAGAIGGMIVDDDEFELDVFLGQDRLDRAADILLFVAGRHDHRDRGRMAPPSLPEEDGDRHVKRPQHDEKQYRHEQTALPPRLSPRIRARVDQDRGYRRKCWSRLQDSRSRTLDIRSSRDRSTGLPGQVPLLTRVFEEFVELGRLVDVFNQNMIVDDQSSQA